jgi:cell wall-associated NlpC family hydrolase
VLKQKPYLSDLLSVPFELGKTDCWWLTREVFKRFGYEIPEYLVSQATFSLDNDLGRMRGIIEEKKTEWEEHTVPPVPCAIAMQFGLPFYHHVGVYIGRNKFIHTSSARGMVTIESLDNPVYAKRKLYTFNGN